jgi:polyphosphate kinase
MRIKMANSIKGLLNRPSIEHFFDEGVLSKAILDGLTEDQQTQLIKYFNIKYFNEDNVITIPFPRLTEREQCQADYDGDPIYFKLTEVEPMEEPVPYIDRELSWLKFNQRVLNLADNINIPLLEQVKFLSITNSNLDEFFSVRIAARLVDGGDTAELISEDKDHIDLNTPISHILKYSKNMLLDIDKSYSEIVLRLGENGININEFYIDFEKGNATSTNESTSTESSTDKLEKYFLKNIFPSLTPLIIDTTRPLPHLKPFSIYIALIVNIDGNEKIGLIEIPSQLERLISFNKKKDWYFIEDVIITNMKYLYPDIDYYDITAFRILRDGDFNVEDNITFHESSYVESMISHVKSRILYNEPVRVDIWGEPRKKIVKLLKESLDISKKFIFYTTTRLKMADVIEIYNRIDNEEFKYPKFESVKLFKDKKSRDSMLKLINKQDVIVHHPYESFNDTVLRFVAEACSDPHVISIKQTLYRSGNDSKILEYLLYAAESGKNVVVVMEIKARFDEETNIEWAEKLIKAGAVVVYGYEHIKTHAKMIHVFRMKGDEPQQFVHIGTGNYSEKNSKIYTDFSYFTSSRKVCQDVCNIFNMLTGGFISAKVELNHIKISPIMTRGFLYQMIDQETAKGSNGYICMKVNNIADYELTKKLYEASNAGVKIDIICRGSCSVIAKIPGYSENIRVISIVGRFLEHSRVIKFGKEPDANIFITSSDMMTRNLDRRLEILFEVTDDAIKLTLENYLEIMLSDTENAYEMIGPNGEYAKVMTITDAYPLTNSQTSLLHHHKNLNQDVLE